MSEQESGQPSSDNGPALSPHLQALAATLQLNRGNNDQAKDDGTSIVNYIVESSKILLVGAGGIGCELLKNLALCGFCNVNVIDLDTIDVSNLNRQFLFRSHHVGQSKAHVACQVIMDQFSLGKKLNYKAHHGNVCDAQTFSVAFFQKYDLVLNALDNVTARRRVNRLCLAAQVPLIEAGTTGYLGQVKTIWQRQQDSQHSAQEQQQQRTACYECQPIPTPKVYPICTIRSTPTRPVHTIVWAKELYKLLWTAQSQDSMLYEDPSTSQIDDQEGEQKKEDDDDKMDTDDDGGKSSASFTYMKAVDAYRSLLQQVVETKKKGPISDTQQSQLHEAAYEVLHALYHVEIQKQIDTDRYKTATKAPEPLPVDLLEKCKADNPLPQSDNTSAVWTVQECVAKFTSCLAESVVAVLSSTDVVWKQEWDKDILIDMEFVTAASNLRSHVFGISPLQSFHDAKGIAGNIIPAIATTNAIIAGLQILQAFHILIEQQEQKKNNGKKEDNGNQEAKKPASSSSPASSLTSFTNCRYISCVRRPSGRSRFYLVSNPLDAPNPSCFVCSKTMIHVRLLVHPESVKAAPNETTISLSSWTLQDWIDCILKKELGFEEPTLLLQDSIIYEEGEGADQEVYAPNLCKPLPSLPGGGISNGTILRVEDFTQDLEVDINVLVEPNDYSDPGDDDATKATSSFQEYQGKRYRIGGSKPKVAAAAAAKKPDLPANDDEDDDDDDVVVVVTKPSKTNDQDDAKKPAAKRKAAEIETLTNDEDDTKDQQASKKQKSNKNDRQVIELLD